MLKLHFWELTRNLQGWVHVTKGRGEDQLVTGASQTLNRALSIRTFWHALNVGGFNFVAKVLFNRLTTLIVLVRPAMVRNRTNVNETHFQWISSI